MKFVCDKCRTKYSIADEKVHRRVLKIRCKNCGNIIVVRDNIRGSDSLRGSALSSALEGAFSPGQRVEDMHRASSPGNDAKQDSVEDLGRASSAVIDTTALQDEDWYLSVDGHEFGPMSFDELGSRVKRGEARGDNAHVWRDGFDNWIEVSKVPELRPFAPPPPPPRSGLFPAAILDETHSEAAIAAKVGSSPYLADIDSISDRPAPPHVRKESSGLHDPAAVSALTAGVEHLPSSYQSERPEPSLAPGMMPVVVNAKTPFLLKVAAIAGILSTLTGIAILVYFLFIEKGKNEHSNNLGALATNVDTKGEKKVEKLDREKHASDAGVQMEFAPVDVNRSKRGKVGAKSSKKDSNAKGTDEKNTRSTKGMSAEERRLLAKMGDRVGAPSLPKTKHKAKRGRKGAQITANEIARLQNMHRRTLQSCYQRALKRDNSNVEFKAVFELTVTPSGFVRNVKVRGVPDSSLGNCMSRIVKRWAFRPPGGTENQTIEFSILFRGR